MTGDISPQILKARQEALEVAKKRLKEEFTGIDETINELIDKIKTWWCYLEFQTRPTIVNLYGMTGVGKTDLIKKLALYLNYGDKLCSINLDSGAEVFAPTVSGGGYDSFGMYSVISRLRSLKIKEDERGILLLDEFHRFSRATREKMNGISHGSLFYDDIWPLLSDGQVIDKASGILFLKEEIDAIRRDMFRRSMVSAKDREVAEIFKQQQKAMMMNNRFSIGVEANFGISSPMQMNAPKGISPESLNQNVELLLSPERKMSTYGFQKFFELTPEDKSLIWDIAFRECMMMGDQQRYQTLMNQSMSRDLLPNVEIDILISLQQQAQLYFLSLKLQNVEANLNIDGKEKNKPFSKLLIFIVANLDSVFLDDKRFVYDDNKLLTHYTKPTIEEVKGELLKLFRPEQVSRLGHNFIFANPILSEDMKNLCFKEIEKYEDLAARKYGIIVTFWKDNFWDIIRREGLSGRDGVRPLFSAISALMGEEMPKILVKAHETGSRCFIWDHRDSIRIVTKQADK